MTDPHAAGEGDAGLAARLPPVIYGSSGLGNMYEALPLERKVAMVRAWVENTEGELVIDTAGKYGAGLALESIGECLRRLEVDPRRVVIGNKLGWYRVPLVGDEVSFEPGVWIDLEHDAELRIDGEQILECWRQGNELLGEPYRPKMLSVHDPDEFLAAATDDGDRERRWQDLLHAYVSLRDLCDSEDGAKLGVGVKDWRVAALIVAEVQLDWVMLANCVTAYAHTAGAIEFVQTLHDRGIAVINSGVFNAGFLVGGDYFDYRPALRPQDDALFEWRDGFMRLCEEHNVEPAHACIQFGVSPPGVCSVALSTTNPERVPQNLWYASEPLPDAFWNDAKTRGLVSPDYRFVGS